MTAVDITRVCVPQSFSGLMALYDWNYHLLHELCAHPELDSEGGIAAGNYLLTLCVESRARYTTTLRLIYSFRGDGASPVLLPVLAFRIRVYHDTRQAELFPPDMPLFGGLPAAAGRRGGWLHGKWRLNRFLANVLTYFLSGQHQS